MLPLKEIVALNKMASHGLIPDLTFYLRLPLKLALQRRSERAQDRMEMAGDEFYTRVLEGYELLVKEHPRFIVLDGAHPIKSIALEIQQHL